jgi:hypothetical protein
MVTPSSPQSPATASAHQDTTKLVSPSLLVSFAATPWLLAIVALQATSQLLERVGLNSEEIFRGDRLPIIHVPTDIP